MTSLPVSSVFFFLLLSSRDPRHVPFAAFSLFCSFLPTSVAPRGPSQRPSRRRAPWPSRFTSFSPPASTRSKSRRSSPTIARAARVDPTQGRAARARRRRALRRLPVRRQRRNAEARRRQVTAVLDRRRPLRMTAAAAAVAAMRPSFRPLLVRLPARIGTRRAMRAASPPRLRPRVRLGQRAPWDGSVETAGMATAQWAMTTRTKTRTVRRWRAAGTPRMGAGPLGVGVAPHP